MPLAVAVYLPEHYARLVATAASTAATTETAVQEKETSDTMSENFAWTLL
jgi:hypothetical protein